jgi:hypothetical protein
MPKAKTEHGILPGDSGFMSACHWDAPAREILGSEHEIFFEGPAPGSLEEKDDRRSLLLFCVQS